MSIENISKLEYHSWISKLKITEFQKERIKKMEKKQSLKSFLIVPGHKNQCYQIE